MVRKITKAKREYSWDEIKIAINRIYAFDAHIDSWNVKAMYQTELLKRLGFQLRTSKKK